MLNCRPNGRRRLGRPLKRLLEEAQILTVDDVDYNDNDDDDDDDDDNNDDYMTEMQFMQRQDFF